MLRDARRQRGLTQIELADLVGVTQSYVSRWEGGYEPPSLRAKQQLTKILLNRRHVLNPLIENMVKHDPSTSVFNARGKFLHVAPVVSKYFRIDASDLVSEEYCRVFEADWRAELYGDMGVSDKILIECEHDVVGIGQLGDRENLRLHGVQTFVQFEPGELIVLAKAEFTPATDTAPELIKSMTLQDLEEY